MDGWPRVHGLMLIHGWLTARQCGSAVDLSPIADPLAVHPKRDPSRLSACTHARTCTRARTHTRTHARRHVLARSHTLSRTHARRHAFARTAQAVSQRYCNCSARTGFGRALDGCADYAQANLPTHLIGGVLVALIISRLPRSDYAEYRRTGQHVPWPSCPRALTGIRIGWHHCCS